jgi:hypothetical protein
MKLVTNRLRMSIDSGTVVRRQVVDVLREVAALAAAVRAQVIEEVAERATVGERGRERQPATQPPLHARLQRVVVRFAVGRDLLEVGVREAVLRVRERHRAAGDDSPGSDCAACGRCA